MNQNELILKPDGTFPALNGFQPVTKASFTCPSGKFLNKTVTKTTPKSFRK
jgi:hypothetical protein